MEAFENWVNMMNRSTVYEINIQYNQSVELCSVWPNFVQSFDVNA